MCAILNITFFSAMCLLLCIGFAINSAETASDIFAKFVKNQRENNSKTAHKND